MCSLKRKTFFKLRLIEKVNILAILIKYRFDKHLKLTNLAKQYMRCNLRLLCLI